MLFRSLDQIRAMKNNRYAPSVVQLCKVAARFNLSLEWLIAGHLAEPGRDVALEVYDLAEKHSVSLLLYHKLSSCDRAIVDTLAQSLLAREKGQAQ